MLGSKLAARLTAVKPRKTLAAGFPDPKRELW
jgi:hypothetical protein